MLDEPTAASFAPHVGDVFVLHVDATSALDATLAAAEEVPWAYAGTDQRVPIGRDANGVKYEAVFN